MKILIHLLPGVGNSLMFTPTLREIRAYFKDAEIHVLVMYKSCYDILKYNSNIDKLILWEFQKKGHIKSFFYALKLRKENYDVSITPFPANKFYYSIVNFLIGGKERISHKYPINKFLTAGYLFTRRIPINRKFHEIEENLELIKLIGINSTEENKNLDIFIDANSMKYANDFIKTSNIEENDRIVGLHPGSSEQVGMINKRWDKDKFVKVADLLSEKYKCKILLFGGKNEDQLKQYIYEAMKNKPIIVITDDISRTAALISKCSAFLTNDTGLMHIAAAIGIPVVVIEGPVDPIGTAPLTEKTTIVCLPLLCRPCYKVGATLKCRFGHYNCLKYVDVDKVVHEVVKYL